MAIVAESRVKEYTLRRIKPAKMYGSIRLLDRSLVDRKQGYDTNIEAIMGFNIESQNSGQLLSSLENYLDNHATEELTLAQYNNLNRNQGPEYVELLEEAMKRGEISKEYVLRVNNKLKEFSWNQYNRITNENSNLRTKPYGETYEKKMTSSMDEWLEQKEKRKVIGEKEEERLKAVAYNGWIEKENKAVKLEKKEKKGWFRNLLNVRKRKPKFAYI